MVVAPVGFHFLVPAGLCGTGVRADRWRVLATFLAAWHHAPRGNLGVDMRIPAFWALAATLCVAACSAIPVPSEDLGSPMPTPQLELQARGGRAVAPRVAWSRTLPPQLVPPLSVKVVGKWFTITSIRPEPGQQGQQVTIALGRSSDGKLLITRTFRDAIAQPFFLLRRGRPMVLLNIQPRDAAAADVVVTDLLTGRQSWSLTPQQAGSGADPAPGAQFHAVAVAGDLIVGQLVARAASRPECAICALRIEDGAIRWSHSGSVTAAGMAILSTSVVADLVGTQLGEMQASTALLIKADTGKVISRRASNWSESVLQQAQVLTREGMVVLERPDSNRVRRAVAVDRAGKLTWSIPVTTEGVVTSGNLVVLPTADGGFQARRIAGAAPRWVIPADQGVSAGFTIMGAAGARVVGMSAHEAIVLDAATGEPKYAQWFQPVDPMKWDGRRYLGWDRQGRLTAYAGAQVPVGIDTADGGEVPVFVDY